jgi:hypothetical protein
VRMKPPFWGVIGLIIGLTAGLIWPRFARFQVLPASNTLVRVDTKTGRTWILEAAGWKLLSD